MRRCTSSRYLFFALVIEALACSANAACNRKETALTSKCEGECFSGRPCLAFAGDANATCTDSALNMCTGNPNTTCQYSCFRYGRDDFVDRGLLEYSAFTFLIPFGTFKSSWELKWNSTQEEATANTLTKNDTNVFPWASNDIVKSIEPLSFRNSTTSVTIAGGTSTQGVRGKAAYVDLSPGVLGSQDQLKSVVFANLVLEQIPAASFPSTLVNFTLANCLLKSFPEDLVSMIGLERLDLSMNYFAEYPVKYSLKSLRVLNLSHNSLTSFDGEFPFLEKLDLSDNVLTEVPMSIFQMNNLKSLYLAKNSFAKVQMTESQFLFLNSLSTLSVDTFGTTSCNQGSTRYLSGVSVCLQSSSNATSEMKSGTSLAAILGGIFGGIVVLAALYAGWYACWRRRAHEGKQDRTADIAYRSTQSAASGMPEGSSIWTDQVMLSLQVNIDDIEDVRKIGAGAFSVVYLVRYRGTRLAASKRLKREDVNSQSSQQFIAEIKLVAQLDHPRIAALIGVAWTIESDLQALFEFMERGDLRVFLESPSTPRIWTFGKLQIAIDIIEALVYVHSFVPPLLHRDLKSRNVLLDNELRAKLSDFGVARYRSDAATMTSGIGTGRWLAPEVIAGRKDYDQACDIWSFGVVLAEMDTHLLPYDDIQGHHGNQLAEVAVLQMIATGSLAPSFSPQCPPALLQVARRCLSLDPAGRPSAVELAYILRTLQTNASVVKTTHV